MIIDFVNDWLTAQQLADRHEFLDVDRARWLNSLPIVYLDSEEGIYRMLIEDPATGTYRLSERGDGFISREYRARISVSLKPGFAAESSEEEEPSIKCPKCGLISYHPEDVRNRYCINCHQFHDAMECPTWR